MSEIKYLENGEQVEVVSQIDVGGFVVRGIFESEDDAPHTGQPFYVAKVFDAPPTAKLEARVSDLDRRISEKEQRLAEIRSEIVALESHNKDFINRCSKIAELKDLQAYLDGRITHYVVCSYSPAIVKFSETKSEYANNGELRLLSLFGDSKGHLTWRLNQYRDGSGSSTDVYPCLSEEEAKEKLRDYLVSNFEGQLGYNGSKYFLEAAQKFGIELPTRLIDLAREASRKSMTAYVLKLEADLAKARNALVGEVLG